MGKKIFALFVSIVFFLTCGLYSKTVFADTNGDAVKFETTINGTVDSNNKETSYKIVLPKDGTLGVSVSTHVDSVNLSLTDSNNTVIGQTTIKTMVPGSPNSWTPFYGLRAGVYYLKVSQVDNITGSYNFIAHYSEQDNDDVDSNYTISNAQYVGYNSSTAGFFLFNRNEHYYTFNLNKAGKFHIHLDSYNSGTGLQMFDSNQNSIFYADCKDGRKENPKSLDMNLDLAPGVYYIRAKNLDDTNPGAYTIKTEFTEVYNDNVEPNDAMEQAQTIDINSKPLNGYLTDSSYVDMYKFVMPADGDANIKVQSEIKQGMVEVLDGNGNKYFSVSDIIPTVANNTVTLKKGTYYLKVAGNYRTSTGAYTVQVTSDAANAQTEDIVKNTVSTALTKKNFASFQIAYGTILQYYSDNLAMRDKYLSQIASLYNVVNTPDVIAVRSEMMKLADNRDLGAYNKIVYELVNNIKDEDNKQYILGEITRWGRNYVWTPAVSHAVDAVNQAWKDKTEASKQAALKAISMVESQASRTYLTGQLGGI